LRPGGDNPKFMRPGTANRFPTADVDYEKEHNSTHPCWSLTPVVLDFFSVSQRRNFNLQEIV